MSGRIRTVKPEWLEDEQMLDSSEAARVLSIALLLLADDHGRGRADKFLAQRIFPRNPDVYRPALDRLVEIGFCRVYEIDRQTYFEIRNWRKHQRVEKPGPPKVPAPPPYFPGTFPEPSATPTGQVGEASETRLVGVTNESVNEIDAHAAKRHTSNSAEELPNQDSGNVPRLFPEEEGKAPLPFAPRARPYPFPSLPDPIPDPSGNGHTGTTDVGAATTSTPPSKRADVQRVWQAFKVAVGLAPKTKFRGDWDQDAKRIADAIDAYDEATCLAVVAAAPLDGMVNGTADEQSLKHETVAYVFENRNTFNRLMRAAEKPAKKPNPLEGWTLVK